MRRGRKARGLATRRDSSVAGSGARRGVFKGTDQEGPSVQVQVQVPARQAADPRSSRSSRSSLTGGRPQVLTGGRALRPNGRGAQTPYPPRLCRPQPVHIFCVSIAASGAALLIDARGGPCRRSPTVRDVRVLGPRGERPARRAAPLEIPRLSGDGEVTVSTMFSFALLLCAGLMPALAAQLTASSDPGRGCRQALVARRLQHGPVRADARRGGDGARGSWSAIRHRSGARLSASKTCSRWERRPGPSSWSTCSWSRARPPTTRARRSFTALRSDLIFSLSVGAVLLCFAPAVVTVLDFSPALFPLLFMPLLAVYSCGPAGRTDGEGRAPGHTRQPHRAAQPALVPRGGGPGARRARVETGGHPARGPQPLQGGQRHARPSPRRLGPAPGRPAPAGRIPGGRLVARLGGDEFAVFMPNVSTRRRALRGAALPGRPQDPDRGGRDQHRA